MRKKIFVLGIVFMFLFGVFVSPAAAGFNIGDMCEAAGGTWSGGLTDGTCTFQEDNFIAYYGCGPDAVRIDTVENDIVVDIKCKPLLTPLHEFETSPDAELDAWVSNCGVNLFSAPTAGSVTITQPLKHNVPQPSPNYGLICSVGYVNSEGKVLDQWNSATNLYYNLDKKTKEFFDQGILNFYFFQDSEWKICDNMVYHPNEGSTGFGRVSCSSAGPTMFGLGTDLSKTKYSPPPLPLGPA